MPRRQQFVLILCLITNIYAQQRICTCSCCLDRQCTPRQLPNLLVQTCDLSYCLEQCRTNYAECRTTNVGVLTAECLSTPSTTTTTTTSPQLANLCSCSCCPSKYLGVSWSSACSSQSCDQSCQNQYSSNCHSSCLTGTCLANNGGRTFCDCRCCTNNQSCMDYRINTNENCGTCSSICQQYSPCQNNPTVTVQKCSHANRPMIYSSLIFFLLISK